MQQRRLPNFRAAARRQELTFENASGTGRSATAGGKAAGLRRTPAFAPLTSSASRVAGTWIPALADDNTIVITASAKDRTSFGCDDIRRLTVFGEAFLGSLAARDVPIADAFEEGKRKISASEREQNLRPSLPQAYLGRNMRSYWLGEAGPSALSGGDVASLPASTSGVGNR